MSIRAFRESDREAVKRITAVCFDGISIDQNLQKVCGLVAGRDWQWRKTRQLGGEMDARPNGFIVAEADGRVVGFINTQADPGSAVGRISHLAVLPEYQKRGLGRALIDAALVQLAREGMECVRIESLDNNALAMRIYEELGWTEVARQIHYVKPLGRAGGRAK